MNSPSRSSGEGDASAFLDGLRAFAAEFDQRFETYLAPAGDVPDRLQQAMRYTALAPGKRLRPYLVARCCELVGGHRDDAWHAGAAVECIHAFSLIHDDLPAMDDDDLRRGRPTCHKQFDEAVAILAGDALSVLAFELLATHTPDPAVASRLVAALAQGAGWSGMIGGQTADILGETSPPALEIASYIHERKTAALFEASCRMGALCGRAREDNVTRLARYGKALGQAFQIADDLLDLTSTSAEMGKEVGKDEAAGKQTFPQCVGMERSRELAAGLVAAARTELEPFGPVASDLHSLATYVIARNY